MDGLACLPVEVWIGGGHVFAVIVNSVAIVLGTLIGLFLRKGIPKGISDALMQGLGVCTVVIGIQGAVQEQNILVMIVSVVLGIFLGEATDLDGRVNRFAERAASRFSGGGDGAKIAHAFVASCLIMNVGAMVIVGSLNAGLQGDFAMLYTKSLLDFIAGIMMAAVMGVGVVGSAGFTLVFQGGIVLLANYIAPYLSGAAIAELNSTGCLIILALGLNMVGITKLKVINYLPALVIVPFLTAIVERF